MSNQQVVYLIAIFAIISQNCDGFEFSGYCQKMCKYGRGGNLCKCSAVHFAGKRQPELEKDGGYGQPYRYLTNSDVILGETKRDLNEDERADDSWPEVGQRSVNWPRFFNKEEFPALHLKRRLVFVYLP